MDGIFKQKLLGLRSPARPRTFTEALFGDVTWATPKKGPAVVAPSQETYSEKRQVLESFTRFAEEKASEQQTTVLKVKGGEVHVEGPSQWDSVEAPHSLIQLKEAIKLEGNLLNVIFSGKESGKVKVIFVSEKFRPWEEASAELKSGFINELIVGFPLKTAELFERMISAMKLDPSEVIVYPAEGSDETDYTDDVMRVAAYFKPEVIITLGAKATSKILKSNDRLSLIHGQFFPRKVAEAGTFQVVPLFHPRIIETNQNMKKTAWADMQKIMKFLKKLP